MPEAKVSETTNLDELNNIIKQSSNMRIARLKRGLSQSQMARLVGTSQPTYSRIESGETREPKDEEIIDRIAIVLNMKKRRLREKARID